MLQSMRSQRVGHDWVTELNWTDMHSELHFSICEWSYNLYSIAWSTGIHVYTFAWLSALTVIDYGSDLQTPDSFTLQPRRDCLNHRILCIYHKNSSYHSVTWQLTVYSQNGMIDSWGPSTALSSCLANYLWGKASLFKIIDSIRWVQLKHESMPLIYSYCNVEIWCDLFIYFYLFFSIYFY